MKRASPSTYQSQNPLFEQWLEEWKQWAIENNNPIAEGFEKALESLRKYPLPLARGKDCLVLKYFGHKVCDLLDMKLEDHKKKNLGADLALPRTDSDDESKIKKRKVEKKSRKEKKKKFEQNNIEEIVISDDESNSEYEKLQNKPLTGSTKNSLPKAPAKSKEVVSKDTQKTTTEKPYEPFFLLPNNFDIILIVDTQETSGGKITSALSKANVLFEVRSLKVGDYAWIAKCRFSSRELILPYIVERKRIDDLRSSIIDGRYKEQKFRLKISGIQNIMYLIENCEKAYHGPIPLSSLSQAAINSQIQDDFYVKNTSNQEKSINYLILLTEYITQHYESKELWSCKKKDIEFVDLQNLSILHFMEFKEFNEAAKKSKNFTVQEQFMRQLIQLNGLSIDKVFAITNVYSTPKCLSQAFQSEGENILANIIYGSSNKKIGRTISKILYDFYTKNQF